MPDPNSGLSPRHRQTLQRLLAGDSEKQIAAHLGVSPHTVHVYVKALYRRFDVSSRGELLARFIRAPAALGEVVVSPE
jgi:DNA-binding CsgD family transcriptional regulator